MKLRTILKSIITLSLLSCSQNNLLSEKVAKSIEADDQNTAIEFRNFLEYSSAQKSIRPDIKTYDIERFLNEWTSRLCSAQYPKGIIDSDSKELVSGLMNLMVIGYVEYGDGKITDSHELSERVIEESLLLTCPEKLKK
jgi:hypothetical protein